jgi:uncharacterized protein (DUF1800 family)
MALNRRDFMKISGLTALSIGLASRVQWSDVHSAHAAQSLMSNELHLLHRATWGVTPQDIQRIQEMGIESYIDWQLNPEMIPDPRVDAFIANEQPLLGLNVNDLVAATEEDYGATYFAALYGRFYRAAYSERQLYEMVVEFWNDHFNIPNHDLVWEKMIDDREVIRKHALGTFRDLLFASAQSRAMLYYLDQAWSYAEHPNENYAREIMELHTLSVEGGYTEADVKALARILTGWTVRDGWNNNDSGFYFDGSVHDWDEKVFLGRTFPAGRGVEEGLEALDMLATHPSTSQFIARKLVRRFVADAPPQTLVDSVAQLFRDTGGDIRSMMRMILLSEEFKASKMQRFKRPVHLLVSILRTYGDKFTTQDANWWVWSTEALGQMPYAWGPPNGYPDVGAAWISTSTLLGRWNLGFHMANASEDWWEGGDLDMDALIPPAQTAGELVDNVAKVVLGGDLPQEDRAQLIAFITEGEDRALEDWERADKLAALLGLLFNSPYFQWY